MKIVITAMVFLLPVSATFAADPLYLPGVIENKSNGDLIKALCTGKKDHECEEFKLVRVYQSTEEKNGEKVTKEAQEVLSSVQSVEHWSKELNAHQKEMVQALPGAYADTRQGFRDQPVARATYALPVAIMDAVFDTFLLPGDLQENVRIHRSFNMIGALRSSGRDEVSDKRFKHICKIAKKI